MTQPNGQYCIYLRKSRSDIEAEGRGEEETYARHERILFELSKRLGITVSEIYRERPVSGERISERPEMLKLLNDVEEQKWDGVLVVEVERLARGDTMDQGIVAQAFKYSSTLIITPMRTYNPNDSNDEEYFEFGLFMSRREFKTITRRMQGGRTDAVKDGRYMGNIPPYGYIRVKLPGKGYSLEPHPEQSPIIQLIFSLYTNPDPLQRKGTGLIAKYLNEELNVPTMKNKEWTVATINGILRNPVYYGMVRWKARPLIKKRDSKSRPRVSREQSIEAQGLHPPLISEELFNKAQEIMSNHSHPPAIPGKISNPFAGLIKCAMCGTSIVLRPHNKTPDSLMCPRPRCNNVSSYLSIVEDRIILSLKQWLQAYKTKWEENRPNDDDDQIVIKAHYSSLKRLENEKKEFEKQKNNLHDLLERNIYSIEVFMQRSQIVIQKINQIEELIEQAKKAIEDEESRKQARINIIPSVEHILSIYHLTNDPAQKNALLKTIIDNIVYKKEKGGRWSNAIDKFELTLYPKVNNK
ncbi:serine recombinase [Paenibacillus glycanilyticus]|uniref:Serine recombinase n=1 Tax=Paenibacillus glycanilyticus TaxID=126569 RepID=A0ABQ6NR13_9BACL|nr:recombinase family protein [Paenibacillus glycanilyticus]GMK47533.1 serine recombinase [Paenibacillus glycanilyticus]